MKTCPIVKHFSNRRIKILPNTKRTLKNAPKTFKFWQSSEISPNLVTLAGGWGRRCLSSSFLRSPNDQFARLTDNSIIEKKGSCLQTKRLKVKMSEREREWGSYYRTLASSASKPLSSRPLFIIFAFCSQLHVLQKWRMNDFEPRSSGGWSNPSTKCLFSVYLPMYLVYIEVSHLMQIHHSG